MATRLIAFRLVLLIAAPPIAAAQDRPVVFVHGMNGHHTWDAAAERLRHRLAITPYTPLLPWQEVFETQVNHLQGQLGSLPGSTIAVGHSQGGIVSRKWSTIHPLSSVVTLGTPHTGAPLADNVLGLLNFSQDLYNAMGSVFQVLGAPPNQWSSVFYYVQTALLLGQGWSLETALQLTGTLGMAIGAPVLPQTGTRSYILGELNSSGNLAREQAAIPARVGLVYVAHNYWKAGLARAVDPQNADYWYDRLWTAIYTLEYAGNYLYYNFPGNGWAMNIADALLDAAWVLRQADPAWCAAVTNDASCSTPHDGVVPGWSQIYPAASINYLVNGPAHVQETKVSDEALVHVLRTHAGVQPRGTAGPLPGGPGGASLSGGQCLAPDQYLRSSNGRFQLSYQGDGNLVVYRLSDGAALWHTGTFSPGQLCMQYDGNLVIYNGSGTPLWSSGTYNYPGAILVVQGDGNVVIYDYFGQPRWATNTWQ